MPMITVQYAPRQQHPGLTGTIAKAVNKLSSEILRKDPNITAIVIEEIDANKWFIGNKSLSEHGLASFWVDIRVVDGTNTREEKAAFVEAVFMRMRELLGPLHNEAYVHVNEVRGDAYGFGGLTQNERYFAGKMRAKAA